MYIKALKYVYRIQISLKFPLALSTLKVLIQVIGTTSWLQIEHLN